jgi:hypothetical protein
MEEDIRLIVLEHLSHKFRVHVLNVDLLEVFVQHHDGLIEFLLRHSQWSCHCKVSIIGMADNIDDDARE